METQTYKEQPYRFVILISFVLASVVSYLPSNNFASIATYIQDRFQIQPIIVALNYLILQISRCAFALPVNWLIIKQGIRKSFYLSAVLMVSGVWLRVTLSTENPYLCLLGSFLSSISTVILFNSTSKLVVIWFRAEMMTTITFFCFLITTISQSSSLFLPGLFISSKSTQDDIINFLKLIALIVSIPNILLIIFIRERPQTPPSKLAIVDQIVQKKNYAKIIKELFSNKNYLLIALALCISGGSINVFHTISNRVLVDFGYAQPSRAISIIVIAIAVTGIVGNYGFSWLLKKTNKYKLISIILNFLILFGYIVLIFAMISTFEEIWQLSLFTVLIGISIGGHNPFFIVYAAQIAFPVDQASVMGYLFSIVELYSFTFGLLFSSLLNKTKERAILLVSVIGGLALVGALLTFFITEDLRRDKFQKSGKITDPLLQEQQQQNKAQDESQVVKKAS